MQSCPARPSDFPPTLDLASLPRAVLHIVHNLWTRHHACRLAGRYIQYLSTRASRNKYGYIFGKSEMYLGGHEDNYVRRERPFHEHESCFDEARDRASVLHLAVYVYSIAVERTAAATVVKGRAMVSTCMRTQKLEESRPVGSEIHLEAYFGKTVQSYPTSRHITRGRSSWESILICQPAQCGV